MKQANERTNAQEKHRVDDFLPLRSSFDETVHSTIMDGGGIHCTPLVLLISVLKE